jgi:hypothetical protein
MTDFHQEARVRRLPELVVALIACAAFLNVAAPVQAQTSSTRKGDVSGGYSSLTDITTSDSSSNRYAGWLVSASWPILGPKFRVTGEVDSNWRKNVVDETQRLTGFLGGLRFSLTQSNRLTTFAHAQVGVERFSEPGFTESGVAYQPGAGVDVHLTPSLGVRAQIDMRFSTQGDARYREVRVAVGAVLRLK